MEGRNMKAVAFENSEQYIPSNEDVLEAEKAVKALDELNKKSLSKCEFMVKLPSQHRQLRLPKYFLPFMVEVLHQVAHGNTVTIIPSNKEFTTQEAADILNVSRPFFVKLLESGEIRFHKVGAHRRIKANDLMSYKRKLEADSLKALEELARMAQEDKLGYE